ncbi:MAG: AMP-dependent synthetase/ligase, partial [Polyangia bacterium]
MTEPAQRTVPELLLLRLAATPDREAFRAPTKSGWRTLSWREVGVTVREVACGLRALGLQAEERCAILSTTRVEWILVDLGILCAGGATTTIYPSNTAEECAYILSDSEAKVAFAEDLGQLAKLSAHRAELPKLGRVVLFDGEPPAEAGDWVISLSELRDRGRGFHAAEPERFEEVARAVGPDALATLVYTSGTTGQPKGVELIHDCWAYEAEAIDALGLLGEDDLQYLWLPLSHVFGKVLEVAQLRIGFASAVDGRIDKLTENLAEVKPTFVAAVPRIFEKVRAKVVASAEASPLKARLFRWALSVGERVSKLRLDGKRPPLFLALQNELADRLVFSKLKARFGGRLRFFVSGSAPLSDEVARFFDATGILICEGYGLTESSAASFINLPDRRRFGTVGMPLPGTEVEIADDGEILIRSRGVMRGYHHLPEATTEALTQDGWLRTGDIGHLEDGFLRITDRKKDLIKTSGGKYVAPQALEGKLKALCPYVSQVLVHGNNRNYCVALLTLDEEAARGWAHAQGLNGIPISELSRRDELRRML